MKSRVARHENIPKRINRTSLVRRFLALAIWLSLSVLILIWMASYRYVFRVISFPPYYPMVVIADGRAMFFLRQVDQLKVGGPPFPGFDPPSLFLLDVSSGETRFQISARNNLWNLDSGTFQRWSPARCTKRYFWWGAFTTVEYLWLQFWWIASVLAVLLAAVVVKPHVRRNLLNCNECGYNLTGNVSGICPECGAAVSSERIVKRLVVRGGTAGEV
jgi:hypothetical protein